MRNNSRETAFSVLVVSGKKNAYATIKKLLEPTRFNIKATTTNGSEARRILLENNYDIIMINCPLSDEQGRDFAYHAAETTGSGVILMVQNEQFDEVSLEAEDFGVMVISKPFSKATFHQALVLLAAAKQRLLILEKENFKLNQKIEEIRIIDRAKYILMEKEKMTEQQSHKYLEKMSMNQRVTKKEMAKSIVRMYSEA